MIRWSWLVLLLLALAARAAAPAPPRPNLVFIMIDTLRADHVGCYGYQRPTTPALDQLAADGVRFRQTVAAASWTMPSLGTMLTGVYPAEHGALSYRHQLVAELTTLAAELQRAGYQTAGVTANPLANRKFGFAKGFDFYDDFSVFLSADLDLFADGQGAKGIHQSVTSEAVNRSAVSWLQQQRDPARPFLLLLLYFDPHYDYVPPAAYATRFADPAYHGSFDGKGMETLVGKPVDAAGRRHLADLYDAEVRYTDDRIGELLAELGRLSLIEKTLVSVISDHGEEFWEHGSCIHGNTLYDEVVMVPWILRFPARVHAGLVVPDQVNHVDVMPTLLSLLGVAVPTQCRGRDLAPLLARTAAKLAVAPAFMEAELKRSLRGVRLPQAKIAWYLAAERTELYDLAADPGEQHDLAGTDRAPALADLRAQLAAWHRAMEEAGKARKSGAPDVDQKLLKQLKALGYMQ